MIIQYNKIMWNLKYLLHVVSKIFSIIYSWLSCFLIVRMSRDAKKKVDMYQPNLLKICNNNMRGSRPVK